MLFLSKGESEYRYNLWSSDLNTIIYNKLSQFIVHAVQYTVNNQIKGKKNALKEQHKSSAW